MSVGIVTPKVLAELTTKMCMRLGNKGDTSLPIHVSQKYSSPERMVLDMEKPRRVFTFCPSTPHNSDNVIESLCTQKYENESTPILKGSNIFLLVKIHDAFLTFVRIK